MKRTFECSALHNVNLEITNFFCPYELVCPVNVAIPAHNVVMPWSSAVLSGRSSVTPIVQLFRSRKQSCRDDGDISRRSGLPVPGAEQEEAAGGADAAVRRQEELLDPRPEGRLRQSGDHQHQGRWRHRPPHGQDGGELRLSLWIFYTIARRPSPPGTRLGFAALIDLKYYLAPRRGAKYCNQRVCMSVCGSVCLSVCSHIFKIACPYFTTFSVHVTCGRGSVLLWRQCNMLWISGFVDIVMFSYNRAKYRHKLGVCDVSNYSPWLARRRR